MIAEYIRIVIRRWWILLIPVIAMILFSAINYHPPSLSYKVTMRFAAGLPPERTAGAFNYERYYTWLSSEYMANGFADVARTSIFAQNIAQRLIPQGLSINAGQIQGALSSDQKQSIMAVYITWPDAAQAVQIGEAISAEFSENGLSYWPQISTAGAPPVVQLDRPVAEPFTASLKDRFDLPVRLILAVIVGIALTFLVHFVDPFLHDRQEIEHLGIKVISVLPNGKL